MSTPAEHAEAEMPAEVPAQAEVSAEAAEAVEAAAQAQAHAEGYAAIAEEAAGTTAVVHNIPPDVTPEEAAKQALKRTIAADNKEAEQIKEKIDRVTGAVKQAGQTSTANLAAETPAEVPVTTVEQMDPLAMAIAGYEQERGNKQEQLEKMRIGPFKFLPEDLLGAVWFDGICIIVVGFFTWLMCFIGGGFFLSAPIWFGGAIYYAGSIKRFRIVVRDEIQRNIEKQRLDEDIETVAWVNTLMDRFWLTMEPVISAIVIEQVDPYLQMYCPSVLDSIKLTTFTLGNKPPRVESVRCFQRTDDDIILMDWRVAFLPNDLSDLTGAQAADKVNPKVALSIHLGKGMVGAAMPIMVEDMAFKGHLRLRFKLMRTFPYLKTADVMFMEPPYIDYKLKPVGGERFGFDIAHFPGLPTLVKDIMTSVMGPMMYRPNVFTLDIEGMMAATVAGERAIGVLKLTIRRGKGLKNAEIMGSSDPYCKISISGRGELARTKIVPSTLNPIWDETHYLILQSFQNQLELEVYDDNKMKKDSPLGDANFDLSVLENDPEFEEIVRPLVLKNGREQGEINFGCSFYPVIEQQQALEEGLDPLVLNKGVLRITIHQAKEIDASKSMVGAYNPYAVMRVNGKEVFKTRHLKRTNNAIWEETFETLVYDLDKTQLSLDVKDDRGITTDVVVGTWQGKARSVVDLTAKQENWFQLANVATGRVRISAIWLPITADLEMHHEGQVKPPIGVIRLHMQEAKRLKNVEGVGGGKSDPYVQVLLANVRRARTSVIDDDLDPIWDEVLYVPVHHESETLVLEVMDFNHNTKDKCIGTCLLKVSDLSSAPGTTISPWANLSLGKQTGRGVLNYAATFHPIIDIHPKKSEESSPVEGGKEASDAASIKTATESVKTSAPATPIDYSIYTSGVLGISINEARALPKPSDALAEVYMNMDPDQLVYQTKKKRKTTTPAWEESCDCFIKEPLMDMLTVVIKSKEAESEDGPVHKFDIKMTEIIHVLSNSPELASKGDWYGSPQGPQINLSFTYTPVEYEIDPSESALNVGILSVDVKSAENLPAADKSGPVHKTKVIKKKLNPVYDEKFTTPVHKLKGDLRVEIFDWNQVNQDKRLGTGVVDLTQLEPGMGLPQQVQLNNGTAGIVNLQLLFRPTFISKMTHRASTSLGHMVNPLTQVKTVGNIAGSAARGGVRTVSTIGGAAGGAVKSVFSFGKRQSVGRVLTSSKSTSHSSSNMPSDEPLELPENVTPEVPLQPVTSDNPSLMSTEGSHNPMMHSGSVETLPVPAATAAVAAGSTMDKSASNRSYLAGMSDTASVYSLDPNGDASGMPGTLVITVIAAENLKAVDSGGTSDPYVKIHVGNKNIGKTKVVKKNINPTWDEKFTTTHITGEPIIINFDVKDHNRIGSSVALGSYSFKLWDHLHVENHPNFTTSEEAWAPLYNGEQGAIHYRLEFTSSNTGSGSESRGRFSLTGKRR
ncbi:C2 domain-containing protein [Syncephalis fuscata]|nr:C2 domain-containing protein [Syncephalis fuscata]